MYPNKWLTSNIKGSNLDDRVEQLAKTDDNNSKINNQSENYLIKDGSKIYKVTYVFLMISGGIKVNWFGDDTSLDTWKIT